MTLVASDIIDQARGRSAAFDVSRHPNKVVLQFLSAKVRELQGKVTKIDPESVRSDITTALPLANHAAGIALGEQRMVVEVVALDSAGTEYPVTLLPATHRLDEATPIAAAWQLGQRLYLTSPASLWTRMVSLAIAVVPTSSTIAALATAIPLPDAAELALVEACAAFMAKRHPVDPKTPAVNVSLLVSEAKEAESHFLIDVANKLTGQVILTRDVYRP